MQGIPHNKDIKYTKHKTPEELEQLSRQIAELIKKGYKYQEISERLNIDSNYISLMLKNRGIDTRKLVEEGKKNRKFLEDVKPVHRYPKRSTKEVDLLCVQIVELLKKGYTHREVKTQLDLPATANITSWLKNRGIDTGEIVQQKLSLKRKEFIAKVNETKKDCNSLLEAAVKLDVCYHAIVSTSLKRIEKSLTNTPQRPSV
jgi:orotate phosphoribosyltransferase-like protein